jgi:lactoylglutathione lyase
MITDLGHAAFRAHDLDRTLAFYAQLGIRESFRLHHADGSLMLIYLHIAGDRFVEVFPGSTIDREPKQGLDGNWQAWISDPDGNAIELMQLEEDSPQRRVAREAALAERSRR